MNLPAPDHLPNPGQASPWIVRWSHLLQPGGTVLDVACGAGRHLDWFARRGHAVTGLDQQTDAACRHVPAANLLQADLEGQPWPLVEDGIPKQFSAVVVTNYLWRPLLPTIVASLAPGGLLLYETFAAGNESVGRPSRPDFLLQPGELLQACAGLHIVAYENGFLEAPDRFVQRIAALRIFTPATSGALPSRHTL
jgi:SAM-dependent methyltransferase